MNSTRGKKEEKLLSTGFFIFKILSLVAVVLLVLIDIVSVTTLICKAFKFNYHLLYVYFKTNR